MENGGNMSSRSSQKSTKPFIHFVNKFFGFSKKSGNVSITTMDTVYENTKIHKSYSEKSITEDDIMLDADSYEKIVTPENITLENIQLAANGESRYRGQNLSIEQLPQFCNQLHRLLEIVRNIQADSRLMGEYPRALQKQLNNEAQELQLVFNEVKCVKDSINCFKYQIELIQKEKTDIIENLKQLEEEEINEIEKTINIKDVPLLKQWERTKRSKIPEAYDRLLEDVNRTKTMLRNFEMMINHKKKIILKDKEDNKNCIVISQGNDETDAMLAKSS